MFNILFKCLNFDRIVYQIVNKVFFFFLLFSAECLFRYL